MSLPTAFPTSHLVPTLIAPTLHHKHCIVHQVLVSVVKLKAIICPQRDLVYVKRMAAECHKLERKRGSGQRIKNVEGEELHDIKTLLIDILIGNMEQCKVMACPKDIYLKVSRLELLLCLYTRMDGPGHCCSQDQIPGLKAAADLLKPEYHGRVA